MNIKVDCKLGLIDYLAIVECIADEYFDEDTRMYTPQFGFLNAMRLFYNKCVKTDLYRLPHNIEDAMDMEKLVADDDFVDAFNSALQGDGMFRFDFANAFAQAMDIVNNMNTSIRSVMITLLASAVASLRNFGDSLTDEKIDKVKMIAEAIKDGTLTPEKIVEAYGSSERFQQVIENAVNG